MNRFEKRFLLLFLLLVLLVFPALADRSRFLDAALSMLEADNPFLLQYNERTGAGVSAFFPLGCPYFGGGRDVNRILEPASPSQSSDYYRRDQVYLYGFDCVGFTRWVDTQLGYAPHPPISALLDRSQYKDLVVSHSSKENGVSLAALLHIGDLLAVQHSSGSYHIAMYIGVLADFGYTADSLPRELSPYLFYPLVIHCTGSGDYFLRYSRFLAEQGQTDITPPFGGVVISILDVPRDAAPDTFPDAEGCLVPCFTLEGYHLQLTDLTAEKQCRWIRWRQKPDT